MSKGIAGAVLVLTFAALSACASRPPSSAANCTQPCSAAQKQDAYLESIRRSGFEVTRENVLSQQSPSVDATDVAKATVEAK
jgi:hypothetical protein